MDPQAAAAATSPSEVRRLCRLNEFPEPTTASFSEGHVQVNLIVLSERYVQDFRNFCMRNPVPCPLIGETLPGDPRVPEHLASNCDIRFDLPLYNVYKNGKLVGTKNDISEEWKSDSVAFLIGCSYSFEAGLTANGLTPRHTELKRNVPMYRTTVPLMPAGVFSGRMIVSMRPYPVDSVERVRALTRPYVQAHGEPVGWGAEGARALGVNDPDGTHPDFGDPTEIRDGEIPVYWGCGVTPQQAVMDSGIEGVVVSHAPGQMLVLDLLVKDVCQST